MKNHDEIRDQFSPLLDGELSPEERAAIEGVLSDDAELLRELDSLKRVDDLYRALPPVTAPSQFEHLVRDRVGSQRVAVAAAAPRRNVPRHIWPGLAAAAVLLIGIGASVMFGLYRSTAPAQLAKNYDMNAEQALSSSRAQSEAMPELRRDAPAESDGVSPAPESAPLASAERVETLQLQVVPEETVAQSIAPGPESGIRRDNGLFFKGVPEQSADAPTIAGRSLSDVDRMEASKDASVGDAGQKQIDFHGAAAKTSAKPVAAPAPIEKFEAETAEPAPARAGTYISGGIGPAGPPMPNAPATPPAPATLAPPLADAAAPASPASASAESKEKQVSATRTIGAAKVPEDKAAASRELGKRTFTFRDGVWYEAGYTNQATVAMKRDSQTAKGLLKQYAEVKEILVLKEPVVLKIADRWYKLEASKG